MGLGNFDLSIECYYIYSLDLHIINYFNYKCLNMDTNIIKVGNSNGIILPAVVLKELKLSTKSTVRIDVEKGAIVIRPGVRQGWEDAASKMHQNGDDALLIPDIFEDETMGEWTWE